MKIGIIRRTPAFELGRVDSGEAFPVHALRSLTSRSARFDWMFEKVVGQPPQVAVANERVASQVSEMMQISRLNDVIATQRAVTQGARNVGTCDVGGERAAPSRTRLERRQKVEFRFAK